jgi:uncharacterized cupin superfamily protein
VIAHWDDAPGRDVEMGHLAARWSDLGEAAGRDRLGLRRIEVRPGKQSTPQHSHFGEEELFYVLAGSGWSVDMRGAYEIAAGDAILYPQDGPAHTLLAGDDGLDVLAFGDNLRSEAVVFPRLGIAWAGGMIFDRRDQHQFQVELERGEPVRAPETPDPRPKTIARVADLPSRRFTLPGVDAEGWFIGRALGARRTALNLTHMGPGSESAPPHCHSGIEELFVVLGGSGTLHLGDEAHAVREGSLVCRQAGSGVAHHFVAGDDGLRMLMYSDVNPDDMVFYPRSGKVLLRGLGITIKPEIVPWLDPPEGG